jgi:Immunity protein 50
LSEKPNAVHEVAGCQALIEWFGRWPSFHDGEILSIALNRGGSSCVRIHTWEVTKEIDAKGHNIQRKHVVVSFFLERLADLELNGFSPQNVISGLAIQRSEAGLQLLLSPCYGIAGTLAAEAIRVEFEPGEPDQRDRVANPTPKVR